MEHKFENSPRLNSIETEADHTIMARSKKVSIDHSFIGIKEDNKFNQSKQFRP
jgi:hypothetical protein